jgi:hypothetical protein
LGGIISRASRRRAVANNPQLVDLPLINCRRVIIDDVLYIIASQAAVPFLAFGPNCDGFVRSDSNFKADIRFFCRELNFRTDIIEARSQSRRNAIAKFIAIS